MDLHTWLAFLAAACVIAVSPGSGAVLSMSHGLSYGVRKTSATIFGLQLGLLLILLVAGAGVGSLLLASEVAFNTVKVLGACYLIYVGFSQWRAGSAAPVVVSDSSDDAAIGAAAGSWQKRCATGFFTNATNPKGIIFMVAVLPQFLSEARPLALQLVILAATMVAVDMVVMHSYAASASALRRLLRSARAMRAQNRVFGGLLMAVGAGLFFVQRGARAS
ncbi:LysE family transporter [Simplicispira psychrophila]|uniref:LysE family transporter n=1 Tax=Simplicispira psychrophila TaxID=80882 RepID=UPI00048373AF|nr:LysE family transporter [Simplicispira psychrophila]